MIIFVIIPIIFGVLMYLTLTSIIKDLLKEQNDTLIELAEKNKLIIEKEKLIKESLEETKQKLYLVITDVTDKTNKQ